MKQQIEIFTNNDSFDLQEDVNEFLDDYEAKSVTITATDIGNEALFMAVVKYQMPQQKQEKEVIAILEKKPACKVGEYRVTKAGVYANLKRGHFL